MKILGMAAAALAAMTGVASAGGIDRSRIGYALLFEQGSYVEFGVSHGAPRVSGTYTNPAFGPFAGTSTGGMAGDFTTLSFGYKRDLGDRLSMGFYVNAPYGANANYSAGPYTGLNARWKSRQVAGVLRYEVTPAISVYGGLRYVQSSATINIPDALIRGGLALAGAAGNAQAAAVAGGAPAGSLAYSAVGESDERLGYIVGAAYEKPEIALRVALTYESGFDHRFATTESLAAVGLNAFVSTTTVKMPQAITLDFQTGIAKDTLLFGSLRWSEWSVWEVRPDGYNSVLQSDITSFDHDVLTWQLGVGRRLNENFSVFARVGYEKSDGGIASRLSPTDGQRSIGIGGTYTKDNMKITAGLEYVKLGGAVDGSGTRFAGNSALGLGVSVGYRF